MVQQKSSEVQIECEYIQKVFLKLYKSMLIHFNNELKTTVKFVGVVTIAICSANYIYPTCCCMQLHMHIVVAPCAHYHASFSYTPLSANIPL